MYEIIGSTNVTSGDSDNYNISPADALSYTWIVTGGAITSGQGASTINVLWGDPGSGSVQATIVPAPNIDPIVIVADIFVGG